MGILDKVVKKEVKLEKSVLAEEKKIPLDIIVLSIIVIYAIVYSIMFLGGPSFYGDDNSFSWRGLFCACRHFS